LLGIIAGLALIAAACGGGGGGQHDASVQDDASTPQFDRIMEDHLVQDDGPVTDDNDSFEQAVQMDFTTTTAKTGVINPAGDSDYFKFTGQAGQWIAVWLDANAACVQDKLDPIVTLYDTSETQIAQNDDEARGSNCDSWLVTRLPADGTYYAKVQDFAQVKYPTDETKWRGSPLFVYKIHLYTLENGVSGTTIDQEPGNDLGTAAPLVFPSGNAGALLGTFASTSDVDVYTFTLAVDSSVYFNFQAEGPTANGSTAKLGQVYLKDSGGSTILARIEGAQGVLELRPPMMPAGSYSLWVTTSGTLGANGFYTASNYTGTTDNPLDGEGATAVGLNDQLADADPLTESSTAGSYFVLSHLATDSDIDYYKVDVAAATKLSAACTAARNGSGVVGLTVSVRDAGDMELRSGTEVLTENLVVGGTDSPINISTAGSYYIRLSKTGQASDVAGTWIRCGIHSRPQS
jgi:hypothetical protein